MARDFRTIGAWEKAHAVTLQVYRVTGRFPDHERFGLVSQMRRAAASIPTNIAEGCGRETEAELARFIDIATGSASELEYQCLLARELGYIEAADYETLATAVVEVRRMLLGFNKRLRGR